MHKMQFFNTIAPYVIGHVGLMLHRIEEFCGVSLLFLMFSEMVELTSYGTFRGCALVQFIAEMLIEGIYFVIDKLAR